ncbi:hypothetical protein JD969_06105 [Planctomycetota bacterium]|nr:hypothetical protein JD969_06105 [Planctomycetota bacterium]
MGLLKGDVMLMTVGLGMPGVAEILILLLGLAFWVMLIVGLILIVLGFVLTEGKQGDGACGSCGYCVIGLTRMICPECGNDLREVGIVSDTRKRWDLVRKGVLVILLPIGLWVVMGVIMLVNSMIMN